MWGFCCVVCARVCVFLFPRLTHIVACVLDGTSALAQTSLGLAWHNTWENPGWHGTLTYSGGKTLNGSRNGSSGLRFEPVMSRREESVPHGPGARFPAKTRNSIFFRNSNFAPNMQGAIF